MIEVKNNRIYFYNQNKREVVPVDFHCMSAYICPHCKMVLAAYYTGTIVDLEPFMEDPSLKYHYTLGTSNGGQFLLIESPYHERNCLNREIISLSARGITYSIDVWAKRHEAGTENLQKLCEIIAAGKVPGFDIVMDACGADDPIVLYNEHAFTNMNNPEFEERFRRKNNLSAYVDWVVGGDRSKPFEPPGEPEAKECTQKDSPPSSEDIEARGQQSSEGVFGDVIDIYTRAQAMEDGVLIDVTETAKEAGIVYPTAVTHSLWVKYIVPPESLKGFQDTQGRLWDVLSMFALAARANGKGASEVMESLKDTAQELFSRLYSRCSGMMAQRWRPQVLRQSAGREIQILSSRSCWKERAEHAAGK